MKMFCTEGAANDPTSVGRAAEHAQSEQPMGPAGIEVSNERPVQNHLGPGSFFFVGTDARPSAAKCVFF